MSGKALPTTGTHPGFTTAVYVTLAILMTIAIRFHAGTPSTLLVSQINKGERAYLFNATDICEPRQGAIQVQALGKAVRHPALVGEEEVYELYRDRRGFLYIAKLFRATDSTAWRAAGFRQRVVETTPGGRVCRYIPAR